MLYQVQVDGVTRAQLKLQIHYRVCLDRELPSQEAVECDTGCPYVGPYVRLGRLLVQCALQEVFEQLGRYVAHILVPKRLALGRRGRIGLPGLAGGGVLRSGPAREELGQAEVAHEQGPTRLVEHEVGWLDAPVRNLLDLVEVVQRSNQLSEDLAHFLVVKLRQALLHGLLKALLEAACAHIRRDEAHVLALGVVDDLDWGEHVSVHRLFQALQLVVSAASIVRWRRRLV